MPDNKISSVEAARLLSLNRHTLEQWLRSGSCPFGSYIKDTNGIKGCYYIPRHRLEIYLSGADMMKCPMQHRRLDYLIGGDDNDKA